jgi:uncharacterized protein (TIGR04141 family)
MSHLFNQGTNAIELLKVEPKAVEQLQELIIETAVAGEAEGFLNTHQVVKPPSYKLFDIGYSSFQQLSEGRR